jgi:hypothetical protein
VLLANAVPVEGRRVIELSSDASCHECEIRLARKATIGAGAFVSVMGRQGDGPGEYCLIAAVVVTAG